VEGYVKLIVECGINEHAESLISGLCRVKYVLPDLGLYVVLVAEERYPLVAELPGVTGVYSASMISAQSTGDIAHRHTAKPLKHSGLTGKGVGIAFLDTGVSPVRDFVEPSNRIVAFKDMVNGREEPYDDNGHGTHVTD